VALLARIIVVLVSLSLACLAASGGLMIGYLSHDIRELLNAGVDPGTVLVMMALSAVVLNGYAALPALAIIAIAEGWRVRSVLFYAGVGGALAAFLAFGTEIFDLRGAARDREIMVGAGVVGGFVYWALAGRNAGAWRDRRAIPSQSPRSIGAPE